MDEYDDGTHGRMRRLPLRTRFVRYATLDDNLLQIPDSHDLTALLEGCLAGAGWPLSTTRRNNFSVAPVPVGIGPNSHRAASSRLTPVRYSLSEHLWVGHACRSCAANVYSANKSQLDTCYILQLTRTASQSSHLACCSSCNSRRTLPAPASARSALQLFSFALCLRRHQGSAQRKHSTQITTVTAST